MAKNTRKLNVIYPEEKEGRIKDANRKLRSDLKREKNKVKQLQKDLASLQRAFDKSCEYINDKLSNRNIEDVMEIIDDFNYKETEKGREKENLKKEKKIPNKCPDCGRVESEDCKTLNFKDFNVIICKCGFRKRVNHSEGNEGS